MKLGGKNWSGPVGPVTTTKSIVQKTTEKVNPRVDTPLSEDLSAWLEQLEKNMGIWKGVTADTHYDIIKKLQRDVDTLYTEVNFLKGRIKSLEAKNAGRKRRTNK